MPGVPVAQPAARQSSWKRGGAADLRRRPLPRPLLVAAAAVVLLALWLVTGPGRAHHSTRARALPLADTIINEADLRRRREVSAADFAPRDDHRIYVHPPEVVEPGRPTPSAIGEDSLAARRLRREADPEDVRRRGHPQGAAAPRDGSFAPTAPEPPATFRRKRLAVEPGAVATGASTSPSPERPVVAGTVLDAELVSPLALSSGHATIVARVVGSGPVPAGTQFLGTATIAGERIAIRFRRAVTPEGAELDADAEAQDADGHAGLAADLHGGTDESSTDEAIDSVAGDAVSTVVGSGLLGRSVEDVRRSRRRSLRRSPPTLSVDAGTRLRILLVDSLPLPVGR